MNYLALAKRVHLILRIGEETPGTQPVTVTAQQSVLAEIVQWVANAHDDICRMRAQGAFRRGGRTWLTPAGDSFSTRAELLLTVPPMGEAAPLGPHSGTS